MLSGENLHKSFSSFALSAVYADDIALTVTWASEATCGDDQISAQGILPLLTWIHFNPTVQAIASIIKAHTLIGT